jgi:hypothetical protein
MLTIMQWLWREVFPFECGRTPVDFGNQTLDSPDFKANLAALVAAATAATDATRLKEFRDIANAKNADEASRQTSILTRAQNLFVALTFFGLLLTFGASFFTQATLLAKWELWVGFVFVVYILTQITIMIVNILRAIGPMGYPTTGSSDFTEWLAKPTDAGFYRAQGLLTLDHYRRAALNNNWRFEHLGRALKGLRNIVLALSGLILCIFVAGIEAPRPAPPAAPQIQLINPCRRGHWWYYCVANDGIPEFTK